VKQETIKEQSWGWGAESLTWKDQVDIPRNFQTPLRKTEAGFGSYRRGLGVPRIFKLRTFPQSQSGWKYGISLDENVKTHPLIRPFKTLTEKVRIRLWWYHMAIWFLVWELYQAPRGIQDAVTLKCKIS
jgi:hypothetical protein